MTLCTPRCKSSTPGYFFYVFLLMVRNSTFLKKCVFYDSFFGCYFDMVQISHCSFIISNQERVTVARVWYLISYFYLFTQVYTAVGSMLIFDDQKADLNIFYPQNNHCCIKCPQNLQVKTLL